MSVYDLILLTSALGIVLLMLVLTRRHQSHHCAHLHHLSDAVVALSDFIVERVPGELPEDVRSFVNDWKTTCEHHDEEDASPSERL